MQQWRQGVVYEGRWEKGVMTGEGKMIWKEIMEGEDGLNYRNEEYRGDFKDDLPDGKATKVKPSVSTAWRTPWSFCWR